MEAAIALELEDKELTDRQDPILGSRSSSKLDESGLVFPQEATSSSCGSRARRLVLLVVALLCLLAGLLIIGAVIRGRQRRGLAEAKDRAEAEQAAVKERAEKEPAAAKERAEAEQAAVEDRAEVERAWDRWQLLTPNETRDKGVRQFLSKLETQRLEVTDGPADYIDKTKYSVEEAPNLTATSIRGARFYRGRALGVTEESGVVIRLIEIKAGSDHVLATMYRADLQCRLVNQAGRNVQGYLDWAFPWRKKAVFEMTQVMTDAGFSAVCLLEENQLRPGACPAAESPERPLGWVKEAFSLQHKAAIVLGALRAAQSMQGVGFLKHGDIKPGNLVLPTNAPGMNPADLAAATRLIDHDCALHDSDDFSPFLPGTRGYVPDELTRSNWTKLDPTALKAMFLKMDVYACGMTLFGLVISRHLIDFFRAVKFQGPISRIAESFLQEGAKHQSIYKAGGAKVIPLLQGMLQNDAAMRWDLAKAEEEVQKFCCED